MGHRPPVGMGHRPPVTGTATLVEPAPTQPARPGSDPMWQHAATQVVACYSNTNTRAAPHMCALEALPRRFQQLQSGCVRLAAVQLEPQNGGGQVVVVAAGYVEDGSGHNGQYEMSRVQAS